MAEPDLVIGLGTLGFGFFLTLFLTDFWIKVVRRVGLVGKDMNKEDGKNVAESGGVAVIMGFSFSVLVYVFFKTFYLGTETHLVEVFALLVSIIMAGFIGFMDDVLGWKKGLKKWQKPMLTVPVAIPLVVINAGQSSMSLPFLGSVDFGVLFPLVIIPAGIIGASNGFNMLAGFNGLEAGMGAVILSVLGYISYSVGNYWLALIIFSSVFCLLGFLVFNKYPAKVFPGDSLTYSVGALIAVVAVLGNMEKPAAIMFFPFVLEFLLKARSGFKAETFGQPDGEGKLGAKQGGCHSLTHIVLKYFPKIFGRSVKEWELVLILWLFELVFVYLALFSVGLV